VRKPKEELVGLVKGLTTEAGDRHLPLLKRPAFYAAIAFVVFVLLNILFW